MFTVIRVFANDCESATSGFASQIEAEQYAQYLEAGRDEADTARIEVRGYEDGVVEVADEDEVPPTASAFCAAYCGTNYNAAMPKSERLGVSWIGAWPVLDADGDICGVSYGDSPDDADRLFPNGLYACASEDAAASMAALGIAPDPDTREAMELAVEERETPREKLGRLLAEIRRCGDVDEVPAHHVIAELELLEKLGISLS